MLKVFLEVCHRYLFTHTLFQKTHKDVTCIIFLILFQMIHMGENPWQVHSIQAFSYLKCPECTFDTKKEDTFQNHATQNHPLSYVLFTKTIKKEDFEDPLTLEITSDDMMPDLIENFKSDKIFPTLEPDEKYIVKTEVSEEQNFEPFDEF